VCVNKEMQIANGFQPVAPLVYDIIGDLKRVTNSKGEGIAEFNEAPHQEGVWSPDATARGLHVISTLMREVGHFILARSGGGGETTDVDSDVKFQF
jgi:hypothetical protein